MAPRWPQEAPRWPQDGPTRSPRGAQDDPKTPPRTTSCSLLRVSPPRTPEEAPRTPPKRPPDPPWSAQRGPKRPQEAPKSAPGGFKRASRASQDAHKAFPKHLVRQAAVFGKLKKIKAWLQKASKTLKIDDNDESQRPCHRSQNKKGGRAAVIPLGEVNPPPGTKGWKQGVSDLKLNA